MKLVAALASGVAAYFLVGFVTGYAPRLSGRPTRRPRTQLSPRQLWLIQAGVNLTPRQFWTGSTAVGAATFALVTLTTNTPVVAVVPAVSAGLLPRVYFARQRSQRLRELQEAWPDGLRELIAGIAAGMSLPQAITALAGSGPQPLRRAFARFEVVARMLGVVPALEVIKEELADPTSDRVIEVLILAHDRGGRIISTILRDLAQATTDDVRTLEDITTSSLEQKINARAVFVLPWLVLLTLTARPGHFRAFYQSAGGLVVVLVAGLLSLLGMWIVGRLGREPVEQRVFGGAAPGSGLR
ncbi:MAG: type II secretion system F family protein [Actinomycetota bacterium]|nr:type II secretion system F family protein [Actinomycetota bacterium]